MLELLGQLRWHIVLKGFPTATNLSRRVHKIDDQTLIQACLDIAAVFPEQRANTNLSLMQGVSLTPEEIEEPADLAGRYAFEQAVVSVNLGGQTSSAMHFHRAIRENGNRVPSARFDEFDFSFSREASDWQDKKDKIARILTIVGELGLPRPEGEPRDDDGTLHELLVGFGATHRHMRDSLSEAIIANEQKRAEIEETFEKKELGRLDTHKKALEELEAEWAKLQLQSYKAERRRIMQQMTDDEVASPRKALAPQGAILTRWAVFSAAILLSLLAAGLAYENILQLGVEDSVVQRVIDEVPSAVDANAVREVVAGARGPTNWFQIAHTIISSLVAIGGLIYAASWLRTFYNCEVATLADFSTPHTKARLWMIVLRHFAR